MNFKSFILFLSLLSLINCSKKDENTPVTSSSSFYKDLYEIERRQGQQDRKDFIEAGFESNQIFAKSQLKLAEVDEYAELVLSNLQKIESKNYEVLSALESDIKINDEVIQKALASISDLEELLSSQESRSIIAKNFQLYYSKESRDGAHARWEKIVDARLQRMSGLRNLFLRIGYDSKIHARTLCAQKNWQVLDLFAYKTDDYATRKESLASNSGTVQGVVRAQNGIDPVSGALVYIPTKGNEELVPFAKEIREANKGVVGVGEPSEEYIAKTGTTETGEFKFVAIPEGNRSLVVKVGPYERRSVTPVVKGKVAMVASEASTLPKISDENSKVAKITVFTGSYDHLENVLSKIGIAPKTLESTDTFSLKSTSAQFLSLASDPEKLKAADLVMINCGFQGELHLKNATIRSNLRDYVNNGGSLFVTDLAYDVVEQVFPEFINFEGDVDPTISSPMGLAEKGSSGVTYSAGIPELNLKLWLKSAVKCGNTANPTESCLNAKEQVDIQGFAGGWAMMNSVIAPTRTWVENSERPLTATFALGKGKVFYSSYHTVHDNNANSLFPQERILQYFVLEVLK